MEKSLMADFDKERKKIMNINKKYNPSEISSKFANLISGGERND
jgi:adenine C2-methylase RlmN of 23S rRNA A2503 and tRNA A37